MFAGVYQWFPKMFGRFMNETLGKVHFWGTFVGAVPDFLANALFGHGLCAAAVIIRSTILMLSSILPK